MRILPKFLIASMSYHTIISVNCKNYEAKRGSRKVEDGIEETLTHCGFPFEHWTRIRTNNAMEWLNREIRRRTQVVGTFPDGNSSLMLVCA